MGHEGAMNETVWHELNRRFPFTAGLSGEALDEAIAAHWDEIDPTELAHMFKRMAMFVESHTASLSPFIPPLQPPQ